MAWGISFGEGKKWWWVLAILGGKRVISDLKHLPTLDTILISSGFLRANQSPRIAIWARRYFFLWVFNFLVFLYIFKFLFRKKVSPRNDQGATKAPRLGLQATIFEKINTNQSRRYDGTKTRPVSDSHIKKCYSK